MGTSEATVHQILDAMMHYGMKYFHSPLTWCYWMKQAHMHYNHLDCNVYSDTFFSDVKLLQGDTCTQMFTNGFGFEEVYPMKADAYDCMNQFCTAYGIPKHIACCG